MIEWQRAICDSLKLLLRENRGYLDENIRRLRLLHQAYMSNRIHLYDEEEVFYIDHYLDSVIFKDYLVLISTELLQAIRHNKTDSSIFHAFENSLYKLDCSDDEQLLVSYALESFLFESRPFLDLYMILVCLLLWTGFSNGKMSKEVFFQELAKPDDSPFEAKARWVHKYFEDQVFGEYSEKDFVDSIMIPSKPHSMH